MFLDKLKNLSCYFYFILFVYSLQKEKRDNKDADKEMKKKIRLEKQKERELMKALKASEKEILKNKKPEECLKVREHFCYYNRFVLFSTFKVMLFHGIYKKGFL